MKTLNIELVNYSEKAIAIFGETKVIKDQLKSIGGRFNPYLNHNGIKTAGWIFSKTKSNEVNKFISGLNTEASKENKVESIIQNQFLTIEGNNLIFKNELSIICFNLVNKEINGHDLTDGWNQPKCYNTKVQGIKKAFEYMKENFNEKTTMYGACVMMGQFKVGMRSYCAMD